MENETSRMIVKRVSVPIGLEELMEGLSKEVLLKKPDDLYEFAARYFSKLLLLRDKTNYKVKTVRSAQTVTEQSRRLTRAPYGTAPKNLSRQFSMRDHSATRRSQPRHPRNESPRRQTKAQNNTSSAHKTEPSKISKNEVTEQSSTKKLEDATEQLEPSVNKVSFSSRRPKHRYDSKRSLSRDKNETQNKGIKSSNVSLSESADTIERTEMIPKRRESNSSTLSNVPSIESSEAKFNTDSPDKVPKDALKEASPVSTPRDNSSTAKPKVVSKRDASASKSSEGGEKDHAASVKKSARDGKTSNKSTSKASPKSDASKCDTKMGSRGNEKSSRGTSVRSPSKDISITKSLKDEHSNDESSKNDDNVGTGSKSIFHGDQSKKDLLETSKTGELEQLTDKDGSSLTNTSTADQSLGKDYHKNEHLKSGDLKNSEGNKAVTERESHELESRDNLLNRTLNEGNIEHSAIEGILEAIDSRSEASKNKQNIHLSETSAKVESNLKSEKYSSEYVPSAGESQKDLHKDKSMISDPLEKCRSNNVTLKGTSHESLSEDNHRTKLSKNEDKNTSASIQKASDTKSNKLLEQNNRKSSGTNSESSSHKLTESYSKNFTTEDKATPASYKSEKNDQDQSISIPGNSDRFSTGEGAKTIHQSGHLDEASEKSRSEANESGDTKSLPVEKIESISSLKQDNQKNSSLKPVPSCHISPTHGASLDKSPSGPNQEGSINHQRKTNSSSKIEERVVEVTNNAILESRQSNPQKPEGRPDGKLTCDDKAETIEPNENFIREEPSIEDAKNSSLHSVTSDLQANKLQEHEQNSKSISKEKPEQASMVDKQLESSRLKTTEDEVTSNTESNKDNSLEQLKVGEEHSNTSKEKLTSSHPLSSNLNIQNERNEITKQDTKEKLANMKPPTPLSTEMSTSGALTPKLSNDDLNKNEQSKEINTESKLASKSSEMKQNVNLTKKDIKSVSSTSLFDRQGKDWTKLTEEGVGGLENTTDTLATPNDANDCDKALAVPESQGVHDLTKVWSTSTNASQENENEEKLTPGINAGSSRKEESFSGSRDEKQASHDASNSQDIPKLPAEVSATHSVHKKLEMGADGAKIVQDMVVSLNRNGMEDKLTKSQSGESSSGVDVKAVSDRIETQMQSPKQTELASKHASGSISSEKTKSIEKAEKHSDGSAVLAESTTRSPNHSRHAKEDASSTFQSHEDETHRKEESIEGVPEKQTKQQMINDTNEGKGKAPSEDDAVGAKTNSEPASHVHQSLSNYGEKEQKDGQNYIAEYHGVKSLSNVDIENSITESTKEISSASNQSTSPSRTKADKILGITDETGKYPYNEQNTGTSPNKSSDNKGEEANTKSSHAKIATDLPNSKGLKNDKSSITATDQKQKTEKADSTGNQNVEIGSETCNETPKKNGSSTAHTAYQLVSEVSANAGDKDKIDKTKYENPDTQPPSTSDIATTKVMTDSDRKCTKVNGILHLPPDSSEGTSAIQEDLSSTDQTNTVHQKGSEGNTVTSRHSNEHYSIANKTDSKSEGGIDKNVTAILDKLADVSENITEPAATVSTTGHELTSAGLKDGNNSARINLAAQIRQKSSGESSEKSQNEADLVDRNVDPAAGFSERNISRDSAALSDPSSITSINIESDEKQLKTSCKISQPEQFKDAKQKCASKNTVPAKSAIKEKLKDSFKSSNSKIEDKNSVTDSNKSGNSSHSNGAKKSPRMDDDLLATNKAKKSESYLRNTGDKQISPKKISLPENQQQNSKDSTIASISGNSSSSSARSSKVSTNKDQSVDSGNNSLTTSSSEKEQPNQQYDIVETQGNEKQKASGSHKRALQRSSKVEDRSSKSLSSSKGSSGNNGGTTKPKIPSEESQNAGQKHGVEEQSTSSGVTVELSHINSFEKKEFVEDTSGKPTEDLDIKSVSSSSVNKETHSEAKSNTEKQPENITQNLPSNTKSSFDVNDKDNSLDSSEKVSSSKASKIPIKKSNMDGPKANGSIRANKGSSALDTNSPCVNTLELEKDESQKTKDMIVRPVNSHVENDCGVSEEDRLILEKLNISHTDIKKKGANSDKQGVGHTDTNANGFGSDHVANITGNSQTTIIPENRDSIDVSEQKTENHVTFEANKGAGIDQSRPQAEPSQIVVDAGNNLNENGVQERVSDELHPEHIKHFSKSIMSEDSSVNKNEQAHTQNHLVSKRSAEEYDGERSSMNKIVEKDGTSSNAKLIDLTLQHKEALHPDVKSFINQFIEKEQANIYKQHCLCKEVRLHDNKEEIKETSSGKQEQVVNKDEAESSSSNKRSTKPSTEEDGTNNKQLKTEKNGIQVGMDLVRLTLKHKDGLHPDVKNFIDNFIGQEQANVYKEDCSCREVRLKDTIDEIENNDVKQLSADEDKARDKRTTTIQKQKSEEPTSCLDKKIIKRGHSVDAARPNGYPNNKVPTAEVKGIQALTVQGQNGSYINKSNEHNVGSSRFDIAKLREELERVQDESKMGTFHNSYNPYKLRQELKQYSTQTGTLSDKNNNTHKTFSAANAVLKIQSMWRGFLVRKVLKDGEILQKSHSQVTSNGMLKSGTGHRSDQDSHSSAIIIANGGHKIPKDTHSLDAPIEASLKEQQRDVDRSNNSEKSEQNLEAQISSQTSNSELNKSATAQPGSNSCKAEKGEDLILHSKAASVGALKTDSGHKTGQNTQSSETASDGQKIPKVPQMFESAIETYKNPAKGGGNVTNDTEKTINNLKMQIPLQSFSNEFDKNTEIATISPGSTVPTVEEGEEVVNHSQAASYEMLKTATGHRSDQDSHSLNTLIVDERHKTAEDTQMVVGQSGKASPKDLTSDKNSSRNGKSSSYNHYSGTVLGNDRQNISGDSRRVDTQTEASPESELRDPLKCTNEVPKNSEKVTNDLETQKSSKASTSEAVNAYIGSEVSIEGKEDADELEKAATALQSMWRGFKARKGSNIENRKMEQISLRRKRKTEDKDMRKVSSISKEDAAALKIQSVWRAYVARKAIDRFKGDPKTRKEEKHLNDVNAAATKIQAHVRGHLLRKNVDQAKQNEGDTKEYRPTSIDSNDSAVTVVYRSLSNNDDYDSLNYDAAIDHVAHMPLLKDEGSITEYQNKLLAQISGKSEETSQKEEADTKSSNDAKQSEIMSTEETENAVIKAVNENANDISITSKIASADAEPSHASTVCDVTVPQKSKDGNEMVDDTRAIQQKSDDARPQTRRGPGDSDSSKSIGSQDIQTSTKTNANVTKQKDQQSSNNTEAEEAKIKAKQSYVTTKKGSDGSDSLRHTGEFHDVVMIPQYPKEGHLGPNEKETFALDGTMHKRNSAAGIGTNEQSNFSSSIALPGKESQVSSKKLELQENEKPDDDNSSRSQCPSSGLEKMGLHHSSEMHDAILFSTRSEGDDSQSNASKDYSKGSKRENHKPLVGGNGSGGLIHSSEYHDSIVIPLEPDDKERGLPVHSVSEANSNNFKNIEQKDTKPGNHKLLVDGNGDQGLRHSSEYHDLIVIPTKPLDEERDLPVDTASEANNNNTFHKDVAQKDAESEIVSEEAGQVHTSRELQTTHNKDLDGVDENDPESSPIGLQHSSELHDTVVLTTLPHKKADMSQNKNENKNWYVQKICLPR